jgi:hypothetical protein
MALFMVSHMPPGEAEEMGTSVSLSSPSDGAAAEAAEGPAAAEDAGAAGAAGAAADDEEELHPTSNPEIMRTISSKAVDFFMLSSPFNLISWTCVFR